MLLGNAVEDRNFALVQVEKQKAYPASIICIPILWLQQTDIYLNNIDRFQSLWITLERGKKIHSFMILPVHATTMNFKENNQDVSNV